MSRNKEKMKRLAKAADSLWPLERPVDPLLAERIERARAYVTASYLRLGFTCTPTSADAPPPPKLPSGADHGERLDAACEWAEKYGPKWQAPAPQPRDPDFRGN